MEKDSQPIEKTPATPPQEQPPVTQRENKKTKWVIISVAIAAVLGIIGFFVFTRYTTSPQTQVSQGPIKIAILGTFGGEADTGSFPALKGAQLAKKDLNATNIEIVQGDTQCDPDLAPDAIQKLIDQGVVAIIGDACSSSSLAALPIANANKVVMISPTASSIKLSIPQDYFFRVVPPDIYQGQFLANLLFKEGYKNVAVVYTNEDYGIGLTNIFKENFAKLGGKVVSSQAISRDAVNVTSEVAALKASNPQAIVILNNSFSSGVAVMKQARAAGITAPFYASDGIFDSSLLTDGGPAVEGLILTTFAQGTQEFQRSLAAEFGETGVDESPQAYDAFKALYLAIQKGARTGEEIAKTLPSVTFDGVSALIKFDENGDVSDNYQYLTLQVKDGKFVPLSK